MSFGLTVSITIIVYVWGDTNILIILRWDRKERNVLTVLASTHEQNRHARRLKVALEMFQEERKERASVAQKL